MANTYYVKLDEISSNDVKLLTGATVKPADKVMVLLPILQVILLFIYYFFTVIFPVFEFVRSFQDEVLILLKPRPVLFRC